MLVMKKRARAAVHHRHKSEKQSGATLEVTIERILPGGAGLAHADGKTVLVALAAPGDRVRVRVERVQGRVIFASIEEILEPSPVRVEPPCPYFGRCGGCDFQQMTYEAQLAAKVEIIRDCLRRIARIEGSDEIPIKASPRVWHYRSRAQWQRDAHKERLGYFERNSHRVCDVAECPVLVPELQGVLENLREQLKVGSIPAELTEFQSVAGDDGASLALPAEGDLAREVSRSVGEHRYFFSADGFFQINHELLAPLIEGALCDARGETALDLYCGVGLFTLPLAARFKHVIGVEANPQAITYAKRNAQEARLMNVSFECEKVGDWLKGKSTELAPVDLLLLDPPRAGVEDGAVKQILSLRPRHIAYVACDPATLARDLKGLVAGGYTVDSVSALDMFPQTHHVETIVQLKESR